MGWREDIKALQEDFARQDELKISKNDAKDLTKELEAKMTKTMENLVKKVTEWGNATNKLHSRIAEVDMHLTALTEVDFANGQMAFEAISNNARDVRRMCEDYNKNEAILKNIMDAGNPDSHEYRIKILEEDFSGVRTKCKDIADRYDHHTEELNNAYKNVIGKHEQDVSVLRGECQKLHKDYMEEETTVRAQVQADMQQLREHFHQESNGYIQKIKDNHIQFVEDTQGGVERITEEIKDCKREVQAVMNLWCRKVKWNIFDVDQKLEQSTRNKSLFSPKFDVAGMKDCQLELRYMVNRGGKSPAEYRKNMDPENWRNPFPENKFGPSDLSLFLWCPKDVKVVFRLSLGKKTKTITREFHTRMPNGVHDFGLLVNDVTEYKTLPCAVEILEVIALQVIEQDVKDISLPAGMEVPDVEIRPEGDEGVQTQMKPEMLVLQKHINHQIFSGCTAAINKMRDRLVKEVTWSIENATHLVKRCLPGRAIGSPMFNAAGIEGMQLIFYPNGYDRNGAHGMSSLFINCPAGVTFKAHLKLGRQSRLIQHEFQERGSFGRTNFCKFEAALDQNTDSIMCKVEILEASQMVTTVSSHNTSGVGEIKSKNVDGSTAKQLLDQGRTVSQIKMVRQQDQAAMRYSTVLPSLFTEIIPDIAEEFEASAKLNASDEKRDAKSILEQSIAMKEDLGILAESLEDNPAQMGYGDDFSDPNPPSQMASQKNSRMETVLETL